MAKFTQDYNTPYSPELSDENKTTTTTNDTTTTTIMNICTVHYIDNLSACTETRRKVASYLIGYKSRYCMFQIL